LLQWDLEANDISASQTPINGVSGQVASALQLAPNGKIYKTVFGSTTLAVINNPNNQAANVNYTENTNAEAIELSSAATFGLPPFTQSLFTSRIDIIDDISDEIATEANLCSDTSMTLSYDDISGATYNWFREGNPLNETSNQISIQAPDNVNFPFQETYTLEVDLNDGSCPLRGIANITYYEVPQANNSDLVSCVTDLDNQTSQFNLTEAENDLIPDNGVGSNFNFSYFTSLGDAQDQINPIANTSDYTNTSAPQIIYVRVENNTTGCADISELSLQVDDIAIIDEQLNLCDIHEDGIRSFDLTEINDENNLEVINFYLTENEALERVNAIQNTTDFSITNPYEQDIYFRNNQNDSCDDLGILTLNVDELPEVNENKEVIYCTNTFPETININSTYVDNTSGYSFLWEPTGETTPQIAINEVGEYTFTVLDESTGCQNTRTFSVVPSNIAFFELEIEEVQANNTTEVIILPESLGDYEYAIDNINGPYQDENIFEQIPMGVHTIYVRDKNGCGISSREFGVLGIPEYFTPNQDGYNDYWQLEGLFKDSDFEAVIYVFDRYGKLLTSFSPRSKGWDGYYNGNPMPSNDYWYRVELANGKVFKGNFTLKR